MQAFEAGQRIRVVSAPDLRGQCGRVIRLRTQDNGAWVDMEEPLPDTLQSFPAPDDRCKWIVLFPEWCEPA